MNKGRVEECRFLTRLFIWGMMRYRGIQGFKGCIQGFDGPVLHFNGAILEFTRLILGFAVVIQVFMKSKQFHHYFFPSYACVFSLKKVISAFNSVYLSPTPKPSAS